MEPPGGISLGVNGPITLDGDTCPVVRQPGETGEQPERQTPDTRRSIGCLASLFSSANKTHYLYMSNLLIGQNLPPIICTLPEAYTILGPVTLGYAWGESTIKDLWSQCAPTPDSGPGRPEKRIISPAHLGAWLADVLQRQGRPMTDQASVYNEFVSGANRGGRNTGPGAQ